MSRPLAPRGSAVLLDVLALTDQGRDRFVGHSLRLGLPQVYGVQLLAQALVAAARTLPEPALAHSLHAYFLATGDPDAPLEFEVHRVRDGRRLRCRTVTARQGNRVLATMTASFAAPPSGPELVHQLPMPSVAPPATWPTLAQAVAAHGELGESWSGLEGLEIRIADDGPPADSRVWLRVAGPVPDDPALCQALLVYLSDVTPLAATLVPHGAPIGVEHLDGLRWDGVSLDHAVWFHRPVRPDGWLLFDQRSPSTGSGRGFARAEVFAENGDLVASLAQEGLFLVTDPTRL